MLVWVPGEAGAKIDSLEKFALAYPSGLFVSQNRTSSIDDPLFEAISTGQKPVEFLVAQAARLRFSN